MEEIVNIHVTLLRKGSNQPLQGEKYTVKFYDKDLLINDYLGESTLDDFGHAFVPVQRSDFRSQDSPLEKYPDIYFTVEREGEVVYISPVCKDLHIEEAGDFSVSGGKHCNLGTFVVDPEQ